MMARAFSLFLLVASTATWPVQVQAGPDRLEYDASSDGWVTAGIGVLVLADGLFHSSFAPSECRFCGSNAFDRSLSEALRWENDPAATKLSDLGIIVLPAAAVVTSFATDGWPGGFHDVLVIGEAMGVSFLVTEALKYTVARERPLAIYLEAENPKRLKSPWEDNISFPSGHASTAFSAVAATATVQSLRGRDALPYWLVGLPLATSVAYFRVAGLHHWPTDVLAGAAIGTLSGIFIPRLLHKGPEPGTERQEVSLRSRRVPDRHVVQAFSFGGVF